MLTNKSIQCSLKDVDLLYINYSSAEIVKIQI